MSTKWLILTPPSTIYVRTKFRGNEYILDQTTAKQLAEPMICLYISVQWAVFRNCLLPVESLLKSHDEAGKKLFINDVSSTHADSTLFGWYAFSRINEGWREGWERA